MIGFAILSLSTAGCALANQLWQFYLLFGIFAAVGVSFAGWALLAPALANWFAKKRGMVLGIGQMGGGMSFVYGMFANFVISQAGWRNAYLVLAGAVVFILMPLYFIFFRYRPEEKGLRAYGADEVVVFDHNVRDKGTHTDNDWTLRQAIKTPQLWLLVFAQTLFWGVGCYLVLTHSVKFTEDAGFSSAFAASVLALYGIVMAVGQVSSLISDKIGRELTATLAAALAVIGILALMMVKDTSQPWLLYVFAVFFGFGAGLFSPTGPASAADIFHGRHFGSIAGLLLTGMGIGGVFGPWLGGYIYDKTGSYTPAFIMVIIAFALASLAMWLAAPRKAACWRRG
jgi:MFS family permease